MTDLGLGELMDAMALLRDTYGAERVEVAVRLPADAAPMLIELDEHGHFNIIGIGASLRLAPEASA